MELSPFFFFFHLSFLSTRFLGTGSISCTLVFITSHITVATTNSLQISSKVVKEIFEDFFVQQIVACCTAGGWKGRLSEWSLAAAGSFFFNCKIVCTCTPKKNVPQLPGALLV